jgi:hypothetical protein
MFDAQVATLAWEYRPITWDQRGHGGTPAAGPFSNWDSARDVLAAAALPRHRAGRLWRRIPGRLPQPARRAAGAAAGARPGPDRPRGPAPGSRPTATAMNSCTRPGWTRDRAGAGDRRCHDLGPWRVERLVCQLGTSGRGQSPPRGGEITMLAPPRIKHVEQVEIQKPGRRGRDLSDGGPSRRLWEPLQVVAEAQIGACGQDLAA